MEHPCHKCGHSVEDGKAFCSQCRAPQIRVALAEPVNAAAAGGVGPNDATMFSLDGAGGRAIPAGPAILGDIEWSRAVRVCAVAALISVVLMFLRLMVPLLAVLGAGCLSVILYRYRNPLWKGSARAGAQLGAVTALLSSSVIAVFIAIGFAILQAGGPFREQALETLQQVATRSNDPQMQATVDLLKQPEGLAAKLLLALVGIFLISVIVGSIGGAVTAAFLGRRNRP